MAVSTTQRRLTPAVTGWDAAPLRPDGPRGGMTRDLTLLDPTFLAAVLAEAEPSFFNTAFARHRPMMMRMWGYDDDDLRSELRLLLLEGARRFNGSGQFAGWAGARLPGWLADASRRALGRRAADLNIARHRMRETLGREPTANELNCSPDALRALHHADMIDNPTSLSLPTTEQQLTHHEGVPTMTATRTELDNMVPDITDVAAASTVVAEDLLNHPDPDVRAAAVEAYDAQETLAAVVAAYRNTMVMRRRAAELEEELAELRQQMSETLAAVSPRRRAQRNTKRARVDRPSTRRSPWAETATDRTGATPKEIRAWAAANNVDCNPMGRIVNRVLDAYIAAHS